MVDKLPTITGYQLIRLLKKDGFSFHKRKGSHVTLRKHDPMCRHIVAVVPATRSPLPAGTLMAILGPKQTNLGKEYLQQLIEQYNLK